jgi:hypothetical protein
MKLKDILKEHNTIYDTTGIKNTPITEAPTPAQCFKIYEFLVKEIGVNNLPIKSKFAFDLIDYFKK